MKTMHTSLVIAILGVSLLVVLRQASSSDQDWPSFRGRGAGGVAEGHPTPVSWAGEGDKDGAILWRTAIPGLGHSSPVILGDRVFLTTAVDTSGESDLKTGLYGSVESEEEEGPFEWRLLCLDRKTGELLWSRTVHEGRPEFKRHPKSSHANATPAAADGRVVSFFGSEGLYCHDVAGKLLWKHSLGSLDWGWYVRPSAQWGGGASPVIHGNRVLVQCDVQQGAFLAAFSLGDGSLLWKKQRDEVPTWSTPTVFRHGERDQVVVNGFRHMGGYDVETGAEIWRLTGAGDIPVPTPVVARDLIFLTSAHGRLSPIYAIRTGAEGDITLQDGAAANDHIAWSVRRGGNYMQTPIVVGDLLYCCRDNGLLSCFVSGTGERKFTEPIGERGEGFTASPVAADGKLYYSSERGRVYVLRATDSFEPLSANDMGESFMASPAISNGVLYLRGRTHLFAVGKE